MPQQDQGTPVGGGRYRTVPRTLCFVMTESEVLLLKGAPTKPLWANQYNGVGGHVERDEDVYGAALRELCEETGWQAEDIDGLQLRGLVNIDAGDPDTGIILFVFTARSRRRATQSSPEGTLEWIPRSRLKDYPLVEDLPVLLPYIFSLPEGAPPFSAHYGYDERDQLVIRFSQ